MANGTTVKECEFKKECEKVAGLECLTKKVKRCLNREFAILVRNKTLRDVLAEQIVVSSGLPVVPTLPIEALKMEVE